MAPRCRLFVIVVLFFSLCVVLPRGLRSIHITDWENIGENPHFLDWEEEFKGYGHFEFLEQTPDGQSVDPQNIAPKRMECSCHFVKDTVVVHDRCFYF